MEYDLPAAKKAKLTRKRPDVLKCEQAQSHIRHADNRTVTTGEDEEMEMNLSEEEDSEEELEGDDVMSDTGGHPSTLPKAASGRVKKRGRNERVLTPAECRAHLRRLFNNEAAMCAVLFGRHGPFAPLTADRYFSIASADVFFMDVMPVPPTRFRPPAKMADTVFEHPQNELLGKIIRTTHRLRDLNDNLRVVSEKGPDYDELNQRQATSALLHALIQLQVEVNSFMDSNKNPQIIRYGKLPPAGVKQTLEKKEGLFRKHMMVSVGFYFETLHSEKGYRASA